MDKNHVWVDSSLINNADPATFTVVDNNRAWSKDKYNVYLGTKIVNADPETFRLISIDNCGNICFGRDKQYLFSPDGNIVEKTDPSSFVVLDQKFAKTNNAVFFLGAVIANADAKTFIATGPLFKDKYRLYQSIGGGENPTTLKILTPSNVDLSSFSFVGYGCYNSNFFKDKNYVYEKYDYNDSFTLVQGADPTTFQSPTCGAQRSEP